MTRLLTLPLVAVLLLLGSAASADLPGGAIWYMHANFDAMRTTDSGREIYAWFEREAGADLKEEFGVDLTAEIDRVTAFSNAADNAAVVIEGPISETLTQKLQAIAVLKGNVDERQYNGRPYFAFEEAGSRRRGETHTAFYSFDVDGKILAAMGEQELQSLLDDGGRIPGSGAHDDALFVLSAEQAYVQAGVQPGRFAEQFGDDDWNSRILRNTEQAVLLISDESGAIAFNAKLTSTNAKMTQSIANIVSGLISLQAFNDELDEPITRLLSSTEIDVDDEVLSVTALVEPALLMQILEH